MMLIGMEKSEFGGSSGSNLEIFSRIARLIKGGFDVK